MDTEPRTDGLTGSGAPDAAMPARVLGRTGRPVSVISLGTWQLGADWGAVAPEDALAVLDASVGAGVTMFDTADVYGDGRSEQLIAEFLAANPGLDVLVATKMGRRVEQSLENYSMANFRTWTDRSRANLRTDTLDLVQLHCPPTDVITSDQVFDDLDTLVAEGVMAAYGVSVETVDQALAAIARPSVASVQIIINAFRLKPLERVLPAARAAGVGIIARVPLASGLLSGQVQRDHDLRRRRPPDLQPARGVLRPGRDLLRSRLRRGGPGGPGVRGPGRLARPVAVPRSPGLGGPAGGRHHGDPRRALTRAGP